MNECDPHGNVIHIHGVEICFLALSLSDHPGAEMDMIMNAICKNAPDADLKEVAADIKRQFQEWKDRRNARPYHPAP